MTKQMKKFIALNAKKKIVSGMRCNADGTEARTSKQLENGSILYQFESGGRIILTREDLNSVPDYQPIWDL